MAVRLLSRELEQMAQAFPIARTSGAIRSCWRTRARRSGARHPGADPRGARGDGLSAGKHCFVEKPLATKSTDAQLAVEAAQRSGKTLMVGHLLEYHPAVSG